MQSIEIMQLNQLDPGWYYIKVNFTGVFNFIIARTSCDIKSKCILHGIGALINLNAHFMSSVLSNLLHAYLYTNASIKRVNYIDIKNRTKKKTMNWDGGIFRKVRQSLAVTWPIESKSGEGGRGEGGVNAKPNLMGSKNQMAATGASSLEIIKDSRRKERKKKELSSTDCEAPGFVMVTCGRARGMSNGRPI